MDFKRITSGLIVAVALAIILLIPNNIITGIDLTIKVIDTNIDTDGDGTSDGRIKYGILFRGAQLSSNQSDATSLQKLGITRELDLRPNSEGKDKGQAVLPKYDIDTPGSEQDVIMHNYLISYSSHPDYYTELRN